MTGKEFAGTTRRHGTPSGWSEHQRRGQDPCPACFTAKQEYDRERLCAPNKALRGRLHARAQQRALKRLKDMAPDVYRRLYLEEKVRLEDEAPRDTQGNGPT